MINAALGLATAPLIVGLVAAATRAGLPSRLAPLLAIALGTLAALATDYASTYPWILAVVVGISAGLSAVGLYSATTSSLLPFLATKSNTTPPTTGP